MTNVQLTIVSLSLIILFLIASIFGVLNLT